MVNAVALLQGTATALTGLVHFSNTGISTTIYANLTSVPPGDHGFHIHQYGDLSEGCESMGAHFNPFNKTHGGPTDKVRHVGDLGNVVADQHGHVQFHLTIDGLDFDGENSILGRGIALHADRDDLGEGGGESKLNGNSGPRIACGVIGLAADTIK
ncbi:superoxide dismutase [Cu-Zn]-like protein [Fennellomyces sp. T-0311]|nr:superoxide dismutase [Cu-Zn]-like protein [Fennellomyces sp. T-0311]